MTTAFDVAAYIKSSVPKASGLKLQKLLYYAQAWHLAWEGRPLFGDRIEAWIDGPVVASVHQEAKYPSSVSPSVASLSASEAAVVDAVLGAYGAHSAEWLVALTHREQPWIRARGGLPANARSKEPITSEAIREEYSAHRYGEGRQFSREYLEGLDFIVSLPEDEVAMLRSQTFERADDLLNLLETGERADADS